MAQTFRKRVFLINQVHTTVHRRANSKSFSSWV